MGAPVCVHNQRDHCKWGPTCHKHHINILCPSLSTCKDKLCKMRHPKTCKNMALDGFCRFGELCSYSHGVKQSPIETSLTLELKSLSEAITEINEKLKVLQAEVVNVTKENEVIKCQLSEEIKRKCHSCCHDLLKKTKLLENEIDELKKLRSCEICSYDICSNTSLSNHKNMEHKPDNLREPELNESLQLSPPISQRSPEITVCPLIHNSSKLKKQIHYANLTPNPPNSTPNFFVNDILSSPLPSPNEVSKFNCEKCEKSFVNSFMLKNHMRYRHGDWVV